MSSYASVKTCDGKYKAFKVDHEVLVYIKQLEFAVRHPRLSKLKKLYWERFKS